MHKHLVIKNLLSELPHLAEFMEALGKEMKIPEVMAMRLNLVIEEAVSNIIMYAYSDKQVDHITIYIEKKKNELFFKITDSGIAFDPTLVKEADVTLTADKRPIGGLGIYIIRNIMDEVTYRRENGHNVFCMKKKIKEKPDASL